MKGNISVVNGFLLLTKQSCTFLGGKVPKLCENWEIKKVLIYVSCIMLFCCLVLNAVNY